MIVQTTGLVWRACKDRVHVRPMIVQRTELVQQAMDLRGYIAPETVGVQQAMDLAGYSGPATYWARTYADAAPRAHGARIGLDAASFGWRRAFFR